MFDLTALTAWLDERAEKFTSQTVLNGKTIGMMTPLTGIKGETALPNFSTDYDLLQDGTNCGVTEKGDIKIDQRNVNPRSLLVYLEFCVRNLETYFTRQILPPGQDYEGLTTQEASFMELLKKNIRKVLELLVWRGVLGGGNPVASLNLVDGLIEICTNEIAAGTIPVNQRVVGAVTLGNALNTIRTMRDALPIDLFDDVETSEWALFVSGQTKLNYFRDYQNAYTASVYNQSFEKQYLDGTRIEVISVPGLFGTDQGLLTKKKNLWVAVDIEGEEEDLRLGMDDREEWIWVKSRFKMGFQVEFPGEVVTLNIP